MRPNDRKIEDHKTFAHNRRDQLWRRGAFVVTAGGQQLDVVKSLDVVVRRVCNLQEVKTLVGHAWRREALWMMD